MKKLLIFLAIIAIALPVSAQINDEADHNVVVVNGTAKRDVVPNIFVLKITLSEADTKGKVKLEKLQKDMFRALAGLKIDTKADLFSSSIQSNYYKRDEALAAATYQLTVRSTEMLDKVFEELNDAKIYNVVVEKISHTEITAIRDEVRIEALLKAQATAKTLAQAIGQEIGKCTMITDYNDDNQFFYVATPTRMLYSTANKDMSQPDQEQSLANIDFKPIALDCRVQASFQLR